MTELTALIVEDDEGFRSSVAALAAREGFVTLEADTLARARQCIRESAPDVILLDLILPDGEGRELLLDRDLTRDAELVVVTGHADVNSAIAALREGALDYLTKPVDRPRLQSILTNVARTRGLKRQVSSLRRELRQLGRFGGMVGHSAAMQHVYDLVARVAPTESAVLIIGESGTGKELVADAVHRLSERCEGPLLTLNCGAIASSLIEAELFGHEKGSFTGADFARPGYFEQASGGTLFLDEVTEMPMELQVRLLRVLETGAVTRVGSTQPIATDVRIIAATNREPRQAVEQKILRADLYYRLNVFPIEIPPLRDRGGDIEVLARHFLEKLNLREGMSKRLSDEAVTRLYQLEWPGNVRELKNVVERAAILADSVIDCRFLPEPEAAHLAARNESKLEVAIGSSIPDVERRLILATLEELGGDKKRAAEVLGISLKTLYNRLNVYGRAET